MSTKVTLTLAELRQWVELCRAELSGPPDSYDTDTQRAGDELRLITAYRDMAIKYGEWWCECGDKGANHNFEVSFNYLGCGQCVCLGYKPAALDAYKEAHDA